MNKPVAWMDDFGNVFEMKNKFFYIPLYTHPVKELTLTDQEIIDIAFEYDGISDLVRFAKAILKKANEK